VALGLHYVGDIIVGVGLGLLCIPLIIRISNRGTNPIPVFLSAVVLGAIGVVTTPSIVSVTALAGGIGGWSAWIYWYADIHEQSGEHGGSHNELVLGGGILLSGGFVYWASPGSLGVFIALFLVVAGIISVPTIHRRITGNDTENAAF
jgi:hypothetical protein